MKSLNKFLIGLSIVVLFLFWNSCNASQYNPHHSSSIKLNQNDKILKSNFIKFIKWNENIKNSYKQDAKEFSIIEIDNRINFLKEIKFQIKQEKLSELWFDFDINSRLVQSKIVFLEEISNKIKELKEWFLSQDLVFLLQEIAKENTDIKNIIIMSKLLYSINWIADILYITENKILLIISQINSIQWSKDTFEQWLIEINDLKTETINQFNESVEIFSNIPSYKKFEQYEKNINKWEEYLIKSNNNLKKIRQIYRKLKIDLNNAD